MVKFSTQRRYVYWSALYRFKVNILNTLADRVRSRRKTKTVQFRVIVWIIIMYFKNIFLTIMHHFHNKRFQILLKDELVRSEATYPFNLWTTNIFTQTHESATVLLRLQVKFQTVLTYSLRPQNQNRYCVLLRVST